MNPFEELGIDAAALAEWNERHILRPPEPDEDIVPGSIRESIVDLYDRWYAAGLGYIDFRTVLGASPGVSRP